MKQTIDTKNIVYYLILVNGQFNFLCDTKKEWVQLATLPWIKTTIDEFFVFCERDKICAIDCNLYIAITVAF